MATGDSPCNLCRSLTGLPVDMERKEGREKSEQESLSAGPVGITPVVAFEDGRGRDVTHWLANTHSEATKLVSQSAPESIFGRVGGTEGEPRLER